MDQEQKVEVEHTIEAVIMRCTCGDPDRFHPGEPCPISRNIDLGMISYRAEGRPLKTAAVNARIRIRRLLNKAKEK